MLPLLAVLICIQPAEPQSGVEAIAPRAAGICLATVIKIERVDFRPTDGNLALVATLNPILASGAVPSTVGITLDRGGLLPPDAPPPAPEGPLKADSLVVGRDYWFAFSSRHEWDRYPQGILKVWPSTDPEAGPILEKAARANELKWSPQFHPQTGLTWGHLVDPADNKALHVRVTRDGRALWTRVFPGGDPKTQPFGIQSAPVHPGTPVLLVSSKLALAADNEYAVPGPKTYSIIESLDAHTGKPVQLWVWDRGHLVLERDHDTRTSAVSVESRYDFVQPPPTPDRAKPERWHRKVTTTFTPGQPASQRTYRYDPTLDPKDRWVDISKFPTR